MSFPNQVVVQIQNPETPFGGVLISVDSQPDVQVEFVTGELSPVLSVFGRIGNVVALCSDYAACYAPAGSALPSGGLDGQVLTKLSNDSFNVGWVAIPSGSTVPHTHHLLAGDGTGGIADSGIDPTTLVIKQTSFPTPTTINQVIACLQNAGLCA